MAILAQVAGSAGFCARVKRTAVVSGRHRERTSAGVGFFQAQKQNQNHLQRTNSAQTAILIALALLCTAHLQLLLLPRTSVRDSLQLHLHSLYTRSLFSSLSLCLALSPSSVHIAMDKYSELARCVENIERDANKFFQNGNKAAGTRARKHLQELKQLAQDLRVLIQNTKNEKGREPQPQEMPGAYEEQEHVAF